MPDFTIETFYHCNSAEYFLTEVQGRKKYTVTFSETPRGDVQYDYSCTCDSFKFGKGKPCKHIKEVKDSGKHCAWMQVIHGGQPLEKDGRKVCPQCGNDVSVARHAV